MANPELVVAGVRYGGWKSVRVTVDMESLCRSFELSVAEVWDGRKRAMPINDEDECHLSLDGEVVIVGFVDAIDRTTTGSERTTRVSGRDRAGDVVDSSVLLDRWEFKNLDVLKLATDICAPYNVSVALQRGLVLPTTSIPKKYAIDPGESAGQSLENLCRVAGVLPVGDGKGGIVLSRASKTQCKTALVEGKNIKSISVSSSHAARFRSYLVLGRNKGTDTAHVDENDWQGHPVSLVKGQAEDREVRRVARNLVVRPEHAVTGAQATVRAEWEATVRAARSQTVSVTVPGWKESGRLWPVNEIVSVKAPSVEVDEPLLITRAQFSLDVQGGSVTELTLRRPTAFMPEPVIKPGTGPSGLWKEIARGV